MGTLSSLHYKGVLSENTDVFRKKGEEEIKVGNDYCGNPANLKPETDCSAYVDLVKMSTDYDKDCKGK